MSSKNRLISTILICFVLLNPFLFCLGITNPYEFPKFIFTIVVAQLIAVVFLLRKIKIKPSNLHVLILIFLLISFIADILGLDPKISLLGSIYRHQGFLLLIAGYLLFLGTSSLKQDFNIKRSLIISSLILSTVTILEFLAIKHGASFPTYNGRVVATLGNPNFLGAYFAITLPFLLEQKLSGFTKIAGLSLLLTGIFISDSRSAILAAGVVLLINLLSRIKTNKKVVLLIPFLFIILLNFNFFPRSSIWDNRSIIWSEGINAIIEKPVLGYGQENFELAFPKEKNFKVDSAHNLFLEVGVSTGIIGLIAYFALFLTAFKKAKGATKLGLISFTVIGFFNPLSIPIIAIFWIMLGMIDKDSIE